MKEKIFAMLREIPGKIGFYYKNLTTGEEWELNPALPLMAASVIKIPVQAEVFTQLKSGKANRNEIYERPSSSCKVTARKWPARFQIPGLILQTVFFLRVVVVQRIRGNSKEWGEESRKLFLRGSWPKTQVLVFSTSLAARHQRGRGQLTQSPHTPPLWAGREGQSRAGFPGSRHYLSEEAPRALSHHKTHNW